ncbi:hypothetical protein ACJVC5_02555 [Peredibacter sp. HCB2-198]|uniref:hypothetical protein n=1 Tax=Peredibacter sp. HCB2-198 TaxID=3383025 RepID=UPI0038B5FC6B
MKNLFLILLLSSGAVFAQTTTTSATNTSSTELSGFSLQRLREKFKISYFSETLGPSIKKWDDNEIEDDGSKKREPMTMYHSFNVRYLLTQNFNLFMSPRVSTVIGDRNDIRSNADPHVVMMDDWQFGIFYTFYKTPTFQYNNRLTHRAPFSTKSRNENIESQIEWQHDFTWMPRPEWRIILWNNYRYYAMENDATEERHRINFTTLINYQINDKFNAQMMHEWDMQHRNTNDSSNPKHRDFWYLKRYKNYFSWGVGYSPIPSLTVIPFIRMLDERNIRNETMMVGLWVLGRVI